MWPNPQFPADLVKCTEETLNGKVHFLCSEMNCNQITIDMCLKFYEFIILMNKWANKNFNLTLLRKSNTLKSLSQNIIFNLIQVFGSR